MMEFIQRSDTKYSEKGRQIIVWEPQTVGTDIQIHSRVVFEPQVEKCQKTCKNIIINVIKTLTNG